MKEQSCWLCGERVATKILHGYPLCDDCAGDTDGDQDEDTVYRIMEV